MSRVLTYVEIDCPAFVQTSPDSPATELTFRFARGTDYLPNEIAAIPSITDVSIQPAIVSLGEDLGQRASVTVKFRDHRHVFDGEDFNSGTFWGKFRARYGLTLEGKPLRLIHGLLGQALEDMETRHYIIESQDGPSTAGEYSITAKDILSLANGDKAQAPILSNGIVFLDVTDTDLTMQLAPTGIGDAEYPADGFLNLGGKEIVFFNRVGDNLTIARGEFNTAAVPHRSGERAQLCLIYDTETPSAIISDLLITYAFIDSDFIPLANWQAEETAYLNSVYTAVIANPTDVNLLISELIQQAALALWWDDINQQIRFQVLRNISSSSFTYDQGNTIRGTLQVTEQPDRRLTQVQIYFARVNPLIQQTELSNYAETISVADDTAVAAYGSELIRVIVSRWITDNAGATATIIANKLLGRYRDPPRLTKFDVMRDQEFNPQLGSGYQLGGTPFQTITGAAELIPVQIKSLNPKPDRFSIEAEEINFTAFGGDIDPAVRTIIFDTNQNTVNLRNIHDGLYSAASSGDTVTAIVNSIIAGTTSMPAFDVGTWPAGVTINVRVENGGIISGSAGVGGTGGDAGNFGGTITVGPGGTGGAGGTGLYTRQAINLTTTTGSLWGGGGGGGGGGASISNDHTSAAYGGGGGGAGIGYAFENGGRGGNAFGTSTQIAGSPGNSTLGAPLFPDQGGIGGFGQYAFGGNGGGAGVNGFAGTTPAGAGFTHASGGPGGTAGPAIDGVSFVTTIGVAGDIRGATIN